MLSVLRLIGVLNAAVWLGAALCFTFALAPAVFAPEMKRVFGDFYTGYIAQHLLERYFLFHYICGVVAILHLLAEWLYYGRLLPKATVTLLVVAIGLVMGGGGWLQPKLKRLQQIKYSAAEPQKRAKAARSFRVWHGVSQAGNLLAVGVLLAYTWRLSRSGDAPRFVSTTKFRG